MSRKKQTQLTEKFSNITNCRGLVTFLKVILLLIWVASAVILSQLVVGYLMLWILGKETFVQVVPTTIYSALSYTVALVWLLFVTPKILNHFKTTTKKGNSSKSIDKKAAVHTMSRVDLGLKSVPTWTDIGLAPIGFIAATMLAAALVAMFNMFPWFDANQIQDVGFGPYLVGADRTIAFIALVIIAPIAEEMIFRGWLYNKLRNLFSTQLADIWSMVISIFLVSLLFGVVHMQWNVGVNVFALSVVLCGMREITGTIYAGILTHMIKNGVAFYLLYVMGIG
ncbi:MAG: CPBP family intramembrane glutamic endopeptidase [Candidatus Saccharimonadaceae bacterium]|nr:CPBP family intramembrane glutamic endopeptidase [Candidatus Saccharimonadaceae bacterium]